VENFFDEIQNYRVDIPPIIGKILKHKTKNEILAHRIEKLEPAFLKTVKSLLDIVVVFLCNEAPPNEQNPEMMVEVLGEIQDNPNVFYVLVDRLPLQDGERPYLFVAYSKLIDYTGKKPWSIEDVASMCIELMKSYLSQ